MKRMKKMFCALLAMVLVAGVCVIPTEARSDNDQVQALQALIDDAEGQTRIYLQENLTWDDGEPIEIPAGKDIILNLNGYTLESLDIFPVFKVESGARLRIVTWSSEGGGKGEVRQAELYAGWESFEEEWLGLFEVEENATLELENGFFTAGYNMFTSNSKGEIVIGGFFNMIPNGNYSIPDFQQFVTVPFDNANWWTLMDYVDMYPQPLSIWDNIPVGQEIKIDLPVHNYGDDSLGYVEIQFGYATSGQAFNEGEFIPFEKAIEGEGYTVNGEKVIVEDFAGHSNIWASFSGTLPTELANKEIIIVWKLDVIENSVSVKNMTMKTVTNTYQIITDTQDSITEEEVSQPVEDVTVVKKQETEQAVGSETAKVVGNILSGGVCEEVVSTETATKVAEAINTGKSVKAEIVVKEMSTEQITATDKKAIEDKVSTELGKDATLQYLDLSIMLKADDEELGTLNKLEEEITVTVAIPEDLKAEGRTYKVIRNHDGVVEVLDTVVNADGTISFKTDRFSTYAIAYADKEETNTNPNPGAPSTDNNKDTNTNTNTNTNQSNKTPSTDTKAPQTGDNNSVMVYVAICFVALAAVVVTKKRNAFVK